jgi:hypothetical protein
MFSGNRLELPGTIIGLPCDSATLTQNWIVEFRAERERSNLFKTLPYRSLSMSEVGFRMLEKSG